MKVFARSVFRVSKNSVVPDAKAFAVANQEALTAIVNAIPAAEYFIHGYAQDFVKYC
jgi:hypothetical protein